VFHLTYSAIALKSKSRCLTRIFTTGNLIPPNVVIPIASEAALPPKRSAGRSHPS